MSEQIAIQIRTNKSHFCKRMDLFLWQINLLILQWVVFFFFVLNEN